MTFRALTAAFCMLFAVASPGHADTGCAALPVQPYTQPYPDNSLAPGIPWTLWPYFLGHPWTSAEITAPDWFPASAAQEAAAAVPSGVPDSDKFPPPFETYTPIVAATPAETSDYQAAAALYRRRQWSDAIARFDEIAATSSPYRAAASYSAARAALYLGHWDDGFDRIARLLADPSMREFDQAAYDLVGTLAYETGDAALVAARFAEISHYLTAPERLICRESRPGALAEAAAGDLSYILALVFPADRFSYSTGSAPTPRILDTLAKTDPFLDLVRVLAAPTRYARPYGATYMPYARPRSGWIDTLPPPLPDSASYVANKIARDQATLDARNLTDHARSEFLATHDLLWGYALAIRTSSPADIPLLQRMLDAVPALPQTPQFAGAGLAFDGEIVQQEVRLLVMSGRVDKALAALRQDEAREDKLAALVPLEAESRGFHDTLRKLLADGVRYFLERRDLDGARKWAAAIAKTSGGTIQLPRDLPGRLALLLARNWGEFVADMRGHDIYEVDDRKAAAAALDLLPARELIALGERPGLPREYKRALLSAGWVRLYMLGRWHEFLALIPEIRAAFPEFATSLDQISGARTRRTQRHLVTRLLLRAPGLSPRVLWFHQVPTLNGRPRGLFAIDGADPDDADWWCPLDVDRALVDFWGATVVGAIEPDKSGAFDPGELKGLSEWEFSYPTAYQEPGTVSAASEESRLAAAARQFIAWDPLFRDVDFGELERLSKAESGPRRLSEAAIRWADHSYWFTRLLGLDDGLPETLHLAVRSTRYGCRIAGDTGPYSHAAFSALHKIFPRSPWTKKTPYWFAWRPAATQQR